MLKSITKKSIALIMVLLTILSAFSNFTYATEISSAYVQMVEIVVTIYNFIIVQKMYGLISLQRLHIMKMVAFNILHTV